MTRAIPSRWQRMAWSMAAASSAIACLSLVATSRLGFVVERTIHAQVADEAAKKATGSTTMIEEMRALVVELEAQAEVRRGQLEKTEASLRRARVLLGELERGRALPGHNPHRPASGPQQNPTWPRNVEGLPEQSLAEKTPWSWPDETATPQACARGFGGGYEVEIAQPRETSADPTIRVRKNGEEIVAVPGHSASVFVRGGDVLYNADFRPGSSGCSIVAYHLRRRQELWKMPLIDIGPGSHSQYWNRVNMKLDGDHLIVYRDEAFARSIELLDIETGKTVGHRGRRGQREFQ